MEPFRDLAPRVAEMVGPDALPVAQLGVRRALPEGDPQLLEGQLRHRTDRRGHRRAPRPRSERARGQRHHAPLPDQRRCHRVAADETAFAYRDANFATVFLAAWQNSAVDDARIKWVRDYYEATAPHSEPGGYINFMEDDDQARIQDNYIGNYDRLVDIKRNYDPDNLFHLNQNIKPSGRGAANVGRRLSGCRRRRDGDGVHGRADRPCGRQRCHRSTVGTVSVDTGLTPTRSSASTRHRRSTVCASTLARRRRHPAGGPEAGLHERATAPEICAYYARVLRERLLASGKVSFYPNCDYLGDGQFVSRLSGKRYEVRGARRVVDARYLSRRSRQQPPRRSASGTECPSCPSTTWSSLAGRPRSTWSSVRARPRPTRACGCWTTGLIPAAICWVRPREPWMLNRAVVQPNPAVFIGTAADTMEAAAEAASPDDLFLRLEAAGIMLRIDTSVTPTMAKTPTLATWELDRLRTIEQRRPPRSPPPRGAEAVGVRRRRGLRRRRTLSSCTAPQPACSTRRWCRSGVPRRSRCS